MQIAQMDFRYLLFVALFSTVNCDCKTNTGLVCNSDLIDTGQSSGVLNVTQYCPTFSCTYQVASDRDDFRGILVIFTLFDLKYPNDILEILLTDLEVNGTLEEIPVFRLSGTTPEQQVPPEIHVPPGLGIKFVFQAQTEYEEPLTDLEMDKKGWAIAFERIISEPQNKPGSSEDTEESGFDSKEENSVED